MLQFQILKQFVFTAVLAVIFFASVPAYAEVKVAVVNIQKIMRESDAAESIQVQLEEYRKSFQDEFSQHERGLMEQEQALTEARADMPADKFAKKRQDFENQLLETRMLVQKRQRALEQAAGVALDQIRVKIVEAVSDIADDRGYDLVLPRQNVVLADKSLDITDDVMAVLNRSLQDVQLDVETN